MPFVAEILPHLAPFSEYGDSPSRIVAAGLFFLLLIGLGVAAEIGLIAYHVKRPVRLPELTDRLISRALPERLVLFFSGITIGFYLLASGLNLAWFPDAETEPKTILFQSLFFHLPVLGVLGLLLRRWGLSACERFGLGWKRAPQWLGLSVLFYLASLPLLWFYNELYQLFLRSLGHGFFMQEIATLLTTPASWIVRTALLFIILVVAPVFEEMIFRGVLLPLVVRRAGLIPGVALLSLLFAGLHGHLPSLLPLFLLSALLSLAYARTQSLWVPIGMHAAFNGVTVILLLWTSGSDYI